MPTILYKTWHSHQNPSVKGNSSLSRSKWSKNSQPRKNTQTKKSFKKSQSGCLVYRIVSRSARNFFFQSVHEILNSNVLFIFYATKIYITQKLIITQRPHVTYVLYTRAIPESFCALVQIQPRSNNAQIPNIPQK